MDSLRNLPIFLSYEEDGTVSAICPMLPDCQCKAKSRTLALFTMQKLIKIALAAHTLAEPRKGKRYEVVHLAVIASSDSVNHFSDHGSRRRKAERPRLEVL